MVRELLVFIGGRLAGVAKRWTSPDTRRIAFRYDDAYISDPESTPLSLRLPLGDAEYEISNWLDGLLPDKESVRKKWAAQQKAQAPEPMSLLATPVGLDCAGAVQFCRPGEEEAVYDRDSGVEWHAAEEIADWARKAKQGQRHQLGSQLRHSLGGWQTKVALHRVGDEWGTPFGDQPTTWILKPGIDPRPDEGISWPNSDLIEHVTMAAARQLGLDAAHTTIEWFAGERVLAVRRYDRIQEHGRWLRTHQEDLCQALDVPPERKYQSDDGPSPGAILDLLRDESSDRAADITRFLDGLIFNWAIGGTDGHAKNYSVLLRSGQTNLAPLYDMMTEIPYRSGLEVTNLRTAMKVGEGVHPRRRRPSQRVGTRRRKVQAQPRTGRGASRIHPRQLPRRGRRGRCRPRPRGSEIATDRDTCQRPAATAKRGNRLLRRRVCAPTGWSADTGPSSSPRRRSRATPVTATRLGVVLDVRINRPRDLRGADRRRPMVSPHAGFRTVPRPPSQFRQQEDQEPRQEPASRHAETAHRGVRQEVGEQQRQR